MRLRTFLIDGPVRIIDFLWFAYVALVVVLSLAAVTLTTVALAAYSVGVRLFW